MALSTEQKIVYLANIISLARADGVLAPAEVSAIETTQKNIGAKKAMLNKAYKEAEKTDFELMPVGSWSDRVKNLEDIIYVSMIDGAIDQAEKQILLSFAKQVRVSQEQLNLIVTDVKAIVSKSEKTLSCPKCKATIKETAKFCPECGCSIQEQSSIKPVAVSYEIPSSGISIEFAESSAAGFSDALMLQKESSISASCTKGKKTWYLASWPMEGISKAVKLAANLKGMRNRKVYVDGKESQWNDVFDFAWCSESRESAYRPVEYCFGLDEKRLNVWGCKQARLDWNKWASWFGYGSFKQGGMLNGKTKFIFDKKRIRHELETNLYKCRLCPHLNFDLIDAVLNAMPNEVSPSETGPWRYKEDYEESPGSIHIKVKRRQDGYTYTDEYHSSGVSPSSSDVGLEILKKAFNACGYSIPNTKGILSYKDSHST